MVALTEPHVPWVMGDASRYPRKKLTLPPTLADTPETRDAFAHYLAEITYMDGQIGDLLGLLEETGHTKDTLVLFTSEQGSQFPGNKWTCWDTGLHTTLIARWPEVVPAGKRSPAIVQYADILPTLLHLSGSQAAKGAFDGSSFVPVLLGQADTHRTWAYGMHNNAPEGPPYPIRTITDGTYRYIRNLRPEELYIEKHLMGKIRREQLGDPYWVSWARQSETPRTYSLMRRFMRRPAEELYHTAKDPYEMTNLAQDPNYAEIKSRLSRELDAWMKTEQDPGAPLDTVEALQAARKGKHLYPAR